MIPATESVLLLFREYKAKFWFTTLLLCCFGVFLMLTLSGIHVAKAAGYIVNSTDDPGDGACTADHCTLREAITSANANRGKDQISFNIPGSAPFTIQLSTALPVISDPVVIDGSTQPGFVGSPVIELDGSQITRGHGLEITGGDSLIRSLVINGFRARRTEPKNAIHISGEGRNVIQGCYLGTDNTGSEAVTNAIDPLTDDVNQPGVGIYIDHSNENLIGGDQPGEGNLISGNVAGVWLFSSNGNAIQGNYVGTDATGKKVIGNGAWFKYQETAIFEYGPGIVIGVSDNTQVGSAQPGAGNLISGNLDGISIIGSKNFEIKGNTIGTDVEGKLGLGNDNAGIELIHSVDDIDGNNIIGGSSPGEGNLISGNRYGIYIDPFGFDLTGFKVLGNKIGTDHAGSNAVPNTSAGIYIWNAEKSSEIIIGGVQPNEGNLISGNEGPGVLIASASGIIVQGNYLGTDINGSSALGNSSGVAVIKELGSFNISSDNLIGGATPGAGNLISGNEKYGVFIDGSKNQVFGNRIGSDYFGGQAIGNGLYGIAIVRGEGNQIGGTSPGEGNLISGNQHAGVLISGSNSTSNSVQGNQIGTNLTSSTNLGNLHGVLVDGGLSNLIGGFDPGAGNRIAFSGQYGVWVKAGHGNSIISNQIFGSADLGIELGEDGITPNDPDDSDSGANALQNYPLLTSVESRVTGTTITGELRSEADTQYSLQFFSNESCDPSGHGEGAQFLASSSVLTDAGGYANFTTTLPQVVPAGRFLTATATSPTYDTSEFSACVPAVWVNSSPSADAGGPYAGDEGSAIQLDSASANDPDNDSLTYGWIVDSTICSFDDSSAIKPWLTCADNGTYRVTLTVTDGFNDPVNSNATVIVNNMAPSVGSIAVASTLISVGIPINANADFSDPGTADTHTAVWDWGDTTMSTVDPAISPISASHTYGAAGVYKIVLTVTDDDGGTGQSVFQYVVVYDPEGGFVTGAGWIDSPAGAYKPDPSLTGKATFGFVSKYRKGASIPSGNTEFQFKTADLNFYSDSYEWLVINKGDTRAQYKGIGTINGNHDPYGTPYRFMLWASDGDPDTFRIKIWHDEDSTEIVIYDNGFEGSGNENGQPVSGGNVVIHIK